MIFQINFFLFSFAQSCIWSYTFVFAKYYAGVTAAKFSVLAMILPALAFFAKPMACSISDAHGIHKQLLITAYSVFTTSYGGLGIIAFLKDPDNHEYDTMAWLAMSICMTCGYVASACALCMNDALASNYARKNDKSYSRMRIFSNVGWASGAILVMCIGDVSWLKFRVPGIIILVIAMTTDILFLTFWPYEEDFEMFHDGTTVEDRKLSIVGPNTKAYLAQSRPRGSISKDMLERIRSGRSKSVGNLPRFGGNLKPIDLSAPAKVEPEKEMKEYSNFQCQMLLIKMIAIGHKSFTRYILLFILFGMVQGMIWTFQLDYVDTAITRDPAEFEFISNLCMIAQSFLGEIPINAVASDLIRIFGANANMSLALVCLGLRCFFYSQLLPFLGPISIVVAEALQGPSLGLYWILIVDVGSNYALMVTDYMPELKRRGIIRNRAHEEELSGCLRASMIGMMSSSMEGLGVAVGSLIGGVISSSLGYHWMWNMCATISIALGFMNIGWDVLTKLVFKKKPKKKPKSDPNRLDIPAVYISEVSKM